MHVCIVEPGSRQQLTNVCIVRRSNLGSRAKAGKFGLRRYILGMSIKLYCGATIKAPMLVYMYVLPLIKHKHERCSGYLCTYSGIYEIDRYYHQELWKSKIKKLTPLNI